MVSQFNAGKVIIQGKLQEVNEEYKRGVKMIAALLELNGPTASALFDHALSVRKQYGDASVTECCIYLHSMENEMLLDTLDILLRYSSAQTQQDPFVTINWILQDLFSNEVFVLNLIKSMESTLATINQLTPLPNDSTTQRRDDLIKIGITENEINVLVTRLKREVHLTLLVFLRVAEKIGFS
jgi:alkyl sulfatase BDS1-like metallo-beta-lactamase superfamily hydrolase